MKQFPKVIFLKESDVTPFTGECHIYTQETFDRIYRALRTHIGKTINVRLKEIGNKKMIFIKDFLFFCKSENIGYYAGIMSWKLFVQDGSLKIVVNKGVDEDVKEISFAKWANVI